MAVANVLPLLGPVAAPAVGSFTAQAKGWRWTIWIIVIAVGAVTSFSLVIFRETNKVTILQYKTKHLRKERGNDHLRPKYEVATGRYAFIMSIKRPLTMLFYSPIIFIVSLCTAVTYGFSYLILTTLTEILEKSYGFQEGVVGLAYLGRAAGMIVGIVLYGTTSDRYVKYKQSTEGIMKPEHRLLLTLLGAMVLPVGLFLYGWTVAERVQWIVPLIGTALVEFSVILTILPTENYLVDAYDLYSASAIAAGVTLRAFSGAVLPLTGPPIYRSLGLDWGNFVFGFIAVAFIPPILALIRYGERIRSSPRFQLDL